MALVSGVVQGDGVTIGIGLGLTVAGVVFSILSRRRDRRMDEARREETERRMAERRAKREGRQAE